MEMSVSRGCGADAKKTARASNVSSKVATSVTFEQQKQWCPQPQSDAASESLVLSAPTWAEAVEFWSSGGVQKPYAARSAVSHSTSRRTPARPRRDAAISGDCITAKRGQQLKGGTDRVGSVASLAQPLPLESRTAGADNRFTGAEGSLRRSSHRRRSRPACLVADSGVSTLSAHVVCSERGMKASAPRIGSGDGDRDVGLGQVGVCQDQWTVKCVRRSVEVTP